MGDYLRSRSLRFWVGAGTALAVAPLVLSMAIGFAVLHYGVISPIHDVAYRNRVELLPATKLQSLVWDTIVPIDEYIVEAKIVHPEIYRSLRANIETSFVKLIVDLADNPVSQDLVKRAQSQWTEADKVASQIITNTTVTHDGDTLSKLRKFHGLIAGVVDRLDAAVSRLGADVEQDHTFAMRAYERAMWIAAIAAIVCLFAVVISMAVIGRVISASVDRLVDGAARFAGGDRDHRIEIQVPPELSRVASEFNTMIGRIHETESVLANMAHVDTLTGVPNRRSFNNAFAEEASRASRSGEVFSILALDLDHFKSINDTHGHAGGDEVLRVVANTMTANVRPYDRVFRVGGEEFVVILPNTVISEAQRVAERLRSALEGADIALGGTKVTVTASIGIAAAAPNCKQAEVMKEADAALYEAKSSGRNRVVTRIRKPAGPQLIQVTGA
ncbi:MAG: diguanylate cyclase [Hyphomicrobiaceae bacterium]